MRRWLILVLSVVLAVPVFAPVAAAHGDDGGFDDRGMHVRGDDRGFDDRGMDHRGADDNTVASLGFRERDEQRLGFRKKR